MAEYVEDRRDELHRDESLGRDERFEEMVARQSRFMFKVALGLLRNKQDAEDAVQEAFLKLYRGNAWLRMEDEKSFLARTVWRVALDHLPKTVPMPEGARTAAGLRVDKLLSRIGLADSVSDAVRKLKAGAVEINGQRIHDLTLPDPPAELIVQVGKGWRKVVT